MKNSIIITIVVAIIVGAAAFFGGMKYQESKSPARLFANQAGGGNQRFTFGQGGPRGGNRGAFGGATIGQVLSIDSDSITVKMQDGSSKIVNISDSTTFSKTSTGTKADVKVGDTVAAIGTSNSDGSVSAQNIQLNPQFRMRLSGTPMPTK